MEEKHNGFKRTLAIVSLAVVFGGVTLGGGLGVGIAAMKYIMPGEVKAQQVYSGEVQSERVVENVTPTVIPISVQAPNYREMISNVKDSVVSINVLANIQNAFGTATVPAAGSGFIFSIDGENVYIATNNHVVEGTEAITISLNDEDMVDARIIGRDADSDLAVIAVSKEELDATGLPYKAAELGDSDALSMGDPVVAMGNAMGEGQTATSGMVSSESKQIAVEGRILDVIQTDAAINQGNSGGPLFNANGEVIGINTAKYNSSRVEGMGYSIPINNAAGILETLRDNGVIEKPYLGITMYQPDINQEMADMFNLPSVGVIIESVVENGAAANAGLMPRDIVVGFNGEKVEKAAELKSFVDNTKVGETVVLDVYRGMEKIAINVVIGNANEITQ